MSRANGDALHFKATINGDGYRITSETPVDSEREIWIFGCSASFGWAIDDHETMPWLLQERFGDVRVRSFCGNGFGTVHALVQLSTMIPKRRPAAVLITYTPGHCERNVAAPTWISGHRVYSELFADTMHPRAGLKPDGSLYVGMVPFYDENLHKVDPRLVAIDQKYTQDVTSAIFRAITQLLDEHKVPLVVALQLAPVMDPVFVGLTERGVRGLSIIQPWPEYTRAPIDYHPDSRAHLAYADIVEPILHQMLAKGR